MWSELQGSGNGRRKALGAWRLWQVEVMFPPGTGDLIPKYSPRVCLSVQSSPARVRTDGTLDHDGCFPRHVTGTCLSKNTHLPIFSPV